MTEPSNYRKKRLQEQIEWHSRQARRNKLMFRLFQIVIITIITIITRKFIYNSELIGFLNWSRMDYSYHACEILPPDGGLGDVGTWPVS